MKIPYISVVSPFYNRELLVRDFIQKTTPALIEISDQYEIILVDDGSSEGTWDQILLYTVLDERLRVLNLVEILVSILRSCWITVFKRVVDCCDGLRFAR